MWCASNSWDWFGLGVGVRAAALDAVAWKMRDLSLRKKKVAVRRRGEGRQASCGVTE